MGYRLGVDLGTTWTAAGSLDGSEITAVELGAHGPAFPSVIAFEGEKVLLGEAAVRNLIVDPTSGAREIKRRLGDTTPFVLHGTPYTAEALMGRILGHVVGVAGITSGGPPDVVALTHPATWGEFKLDLLREAGRVAGLAEVELIPEPSAAAAHYARAGKVAADGLVGVYDFGGGTFDAAVLQGTAGHFEILGKAEGLDRLGGVDLDQAVIAHVAKALDGALSDLDRENPDVRQALGELREACVVAKEALSSETEVTIPVAVPGLNTEVRLTRAEFEGAIRPRLDETLDAFERAVKGAGVEVAALDVVLLVGGSSRIPVVAEMLAARTGRPIALDTDTKAAVSLGAAGWGAGTGAAVAGASVLVVAGAEELGPATSGGGDTAPGEGGATAKVSRRERRAQAAETAPKQPKQPKESGGLGRAAKVVAGGAAAAVVAGGGVAAYAATDGDFGLPGSGQGGGTDTDDRADGAPDDEGDGDKGVPAKPGGFDPVTGEAESLDAFDEVSAPSRGGGGGAVAHGGGGGSASAGASSSGTAQAPLHQAAQARIAVDDGPGGMAPPSGHASETDAARVGGRDMSERDLPGRDDTDDRDEMGSTRPGGSSGEAPAPMGPTEDEQVEMIKANLRARLDAWQPPAGADQAEVAALKNELEGRIDRFDPADGVAFENAAGDLQRALDDSLEDFQQNEQIDKLQQTDQALIEEQNREAAEEREELEDKNGFIEYQGALSAFVANYKPNFSPWVDEREMAALKGRLLADISQAPFDSDRDLRTQQIALERAMRSQLETFNRNQHVARYEAEVARIEAARGAAIAVRDDTTKSPQERSDAAGELPTLESQRELVNNLMTDIKDGYGNPDPAAEAALHAHLEPEELDFASEYIQSDELSYSRTAALLAEGKEGVADGWVTSVDNSDSATAIVSDVVGVHSSALLDVFDDGPPAALATMSTMSTEAPAPQLSSESQMSGGGPPLPPGIQTMAAPEPMPSEVSPPPLDPMDDALGTPVVATPVVATPVVPAPSVPSAPEDAPRMPVGADPLDDVTSPVSDSPDSPTGIPDDGLPNAMSSPIDDLSEDDSLNALDDLDDPLDPMNP